MPEKVTYAIRRRLAILSTEESSGWTKEANIVSWNGGPEKVDIRRWNPDHTKMSKGITLDKEEASELSEVLAELFR